MLVGWEVVEVVVNFSGMVLVIFVIVVVLFFKIIKLIVYMGESWKVFRF